MDFLGRVTPHQIHPGYSLTNWDYNSNFNVGHKDRLSILTFESGSGSASLNGCDFFIVAPMIVCINETENFLIKEATGLKGREFSFKLDFINPNFNFINARELDHSFSPNDIEDALKLSIFFKRYNNYLGQVPASEPALKHLNKVFDNLCYELNPSDLVMTGVIGYIDRLVKTNLALSASIISETSFEIKDILLYLHNNYKNKITIPLLSKQFHVNRTTLSDRFFEATGETIITYLNKYRINLATIMLRDSKLTISEIAEEIGFNDTAYFAKLFKKYMNHTPTGYRERYYKLSQFHTFPKK